MEKIISGKVRDVYAIDESKLVIVTTDKISAFDVIMPTPVPGKGKVLNQVANFWFDYTKDLVKNHLITTNLKDMPEFFQSDEYEDRTIMVKRLKMIPYEIIVRGYIFGSMWKSYEAGEDFCGHPFTRTYQQAEKLDKPILTPSTKSKTGHDINVSFADMASDIGADLSNQIEKISLAIYERCADYALSKGIIIADTKFEFGLDENGELVLADEVLTPDSSRFWDASRYQTGTSPESFDKQFLRDWLIANHLDGVSPAPEIPAEIIAKTSEKYAQCLKMLTA